VQKIIVRCLLNETHEKMKLHEYQNRIVTFLHQHPHAILSVDMGLGKTAATLTFIEQAHPKSLLIVAPKRVAESVWLQEAEKWGYAHTASQMVIVKGTPKQRAKAIADKEHPYKIISRDNLKDVYGYKCDLLVIDELTSFKSVQSKRTQAVLSIQASRKVGLTGTFLANGAIDIFGQCAAVGLRFGGGLNFYAWRAMNFHDAVAGAGLQFQKWVLNKGVTIEHLLRDVQDCIFTLTAADYLEIPDVQHQWHRIELAPETRKAYDDLNAFLGFNLGDGVLTFEEGAKFAKLQTLCNGFVYDEKGTPVRGKDSAKLEEVADFVAECAEDGENVLLFYAYREEAVWLGEMLTKRGITFESVKKEGFVERWNAGKTQCLFAHPASAGHGLNLQNGGRVIVWSSLTYNYELYAQANARLARQGQTRNVQIHYFMAEDTCEWQMWNALQKKDKEQNEFLTLTKQ
jgi:SNF2 family DNA or RNA helicase